MSSCNNRCGGGCSDFSSRAQRLPNLLAIEVVSQLLEQAMRNMAVRAASVSSGMMDAGEYELNREKLTKWLVALFSGENPHFESDAEWHRGGGLAQYLREAMNAPFAGEREVLRRACEQFSAEADELARDFTETGGSAAALEQRSQAVIRWAHIFTGAPEAF